MGSGTTKVAQKLRCKCQKSACLKKYCQCYHANVRCSANCRCVGCLNIPLSGGFGPGSAPVVGMSMVGSRVPPNHQGDGNNEMRNFASPTRGGGGVVMPPLPMQYRLVLIRNIFLVRRLLPLLLLSIAAVVPMEVMRVEVAAVATRLGWWTPHRT